MDATGWMFRLRSGTAMGATALRAGAVLMAAMALLALWPPLDAVGMGLSICAIVLAICQWWAGARVGALAAAAVRGRREIETTADLQSFER